MGKRPMTKAQVLKAEKAEPKGTKGEAKESPALKKAERKFKVK